MVKSKKIIPILTALTLMLGLFIGTSSVFALGQGAYTTQVSPHYRNPVTGTIEDQGGESKEALGQGMTESTTYSQGLIEVDSSGQMYATVRLKMRDAIANPVFSINGSRVSAVEVQSDPSTNSGDFRFPIPSLNSVVRIAFHVVPMDRDVIYFVTFSGANPGHSDFVVNVKTQEESSANASSKDGSKDSKDKKSQKEDAKLKKTREKAVKSITKTYDENKKSINKELKDLDDSKLDKKFKEEQKKNLSALLVKFDKAKKKGIENIDKASDEKSITKAEKSAKDSLSKLEKDFTKIQKEIKSKLDADKKAKEEKKAKESKMIWVGVIVGIAVITIIVGVVLSKRKKTGKK